MEDTSGRYKDGSGKIWYCSYKPNVGDIRGPSVHCETKQGEFTAAYLETFKTWGWTKL